MQFRQIAIGAVCLCLSGVAYWLSPYGGMSIMLAVTGVMCLLHAALVPYGHKVTVQLAIQAGGAICWGVFFSVMPIVEVLTFGVIIWLPVLILFERKRAERYGFLQGAVMRGAIVALIVFAASRAPLKYEDREIGPLSNSEMTLASLGQEMRSHGWRLDAPESQSHQMIYLPAGPLTMRQLMQSIEGGTELEAFIPYCANDMSVLWGAYPISREVWVIPKETE